MVRFPFEGHVEIAFETRPIGLNRKVVPTDRSADVARIVAEPFFKGAFEPIAVASYPACGLDLIVGSCARDHLTDHVAARHRVGYPARHKVRRAANRSHGSLPAPGPVEVFHQVKPLARAQRKGRTYG